MFRCIHNSILLFGSYLHLHLQTCLYSHLWVAFSITCAFALNFTFSFPIVFWQPQFCSQFADTYSYSNTILLLNKSASLWVRACRVLECFAPRRQQLGRQGAQAWPEVGLGGKVGINFSARPKASQNVRPEATRHATQARRPQRKIRQPDWPSTCFRFELVF